MLRITVLMIFVLFAVAFAQIKLPPNPGAAGKKTVLGIDSDGDGVRDDIQIEITKLIPNDPYARAGAMFFFAVQQEIFRIYLENPNESFEFFYPYFLMSMAGATHYVQTGAENLIPVEKFLIMLLNTRERFLVNDKLDSIAHGKGITHYSHYPEFREKYDKKFQEFYEREKDRQK
ncbi:MAG: hypothetical protein FWF51_00430 [Chitinivibrionia bacterium]|nr:hypothetical protein [Chitinivibrionia bacterium]